MKDVSDIDEIIFAIVRCRLYHCIDWIVVLIFFLHFCCCMV